ncbi:MAG: hypothetical protein ABIQ07_02325 [Ginsengibacter sp.]
MKVITSIQLKSALLIIVFSLNTIIGFTCAAGIDLGFNSTHHHEEESAEVTMHVHADGKKHEHHNEVGKHHDQASNTNKANDNKDNCCNDEVIKITQLDKSVPQSLSAISPGFFTILISSSYNIDPLFTSQNVSIKYFVRSHHPPIPDIRIAIQSFQI